MSELQQLKAAAYDLMVKIQTDQIQLQDLHNQIATMQNQKTLSDEANKQS